MSTNIIEIDPKSRIYRFYSSFFPDEPSNLCQYVRRILGALFVVITGSIIFSVVGLILLAFLVYPILPVIFTNTFEPLLLIISGVLWLTLIVNFRREITTQINKHRKVKPQSEKVNKKPNVFVEYLKAKKQKICPMITVKREDHEYY